MVKKGYWLRVFIGMQMQSIVQPEEDENFEILDFTTSSPWEKFVAEVEGIFIKWGIGKKKQSGVSSFSGSNEAVREVPFLKPQLAAVIPELLQGEEKVEIQTEVVSFSGNMFQLTYVKSASGESIWDQLQCQDNDFIMLGNEIERWFGLKHFVVISSFVGEEEKSLPIFLPISDSATEELDDLVENDQNSVDEVKSLDWETDQRIKAISETSRIYYFIIISSIAIIVVIVYIIYFLFFCFVFCFVISIFILILNS